MIWTIARKDFLLHLMTFRFAVGTALGIILVSVFVPVLARDYQQRSREYYANVSANETAMRGVMVYRNLTPTIYRPPSALSVFSEGLDKRLGASVKVDRSSAPEIGTGSTEVNPYMSVFPALDISLILQVVFSALALLVAYDVVSGEREQETLKLVLSGGVPRNRLLVGKLLAGLFILIVPVTMVFLLGLLLLLLFPQVSLSASDWAGVGLMYLASLLFISAMFNLGLCLSCLMRKSAISLVLGLLAWLVFVVIIPNGSVCLATRIHPLEPREKWESRRAALTDDYVLKVRSLRGRFPGCSGPKSDAVDSQGKYYTVLCATSCMQALSKCSPLEESASIAYGNQLWDLELASVEGLLNQTRLARRIARISPVCVYGSAMSALARSDLTSFRRFLDSARTYRNQVIEYIRARTADFSSYAHFTVCDEQEAASYEKIMAQHGAATNDAERQRVRDALFALMDKKVAQTPSLDLRDFPRFVHYPSVAGSLSKAGPDLLILAFVNALLFTLSFSAFIRYDVR